MPKTITSVSLPEKVLAEAETAAKEQHKSRSEIIKDALMEYLREYRFKKAQAEVRSYAVRKGVRTEEDVENVLRELRTGKYGKR